MTNSGHGRTLRRFRASSRSQTPSQPVLYSELVRPRVFVLACLAGYWLLTTTLPVRAQSATAPVPLDVALDRTATYIDSFIEHFGNVVSEERYQQEAVPAIRAGQLGGRGTMASIPPTQKRTLRSDFLLVKPEGSADWFPFRDVYEVDGTIIRDSSSCTAG